jgi:site-specific recombinase XerD
MNDIIEVNDKHEIVDSQQICRYQLPAVAYLARLSPQSQRSVQRALDRIAAYLIPGSNAIVFPWEQVRYHHAIAVRTWLLATYAPSTVNSMLAALRNVLHEARRLGIMNADLCLAACDVPSVRGERLPAGRALAADEIEALIRVCVDDQTLTGVRDTAILALLYGTGIRRSEACNLDITDYHQGDATLTIRGGKGNKDRKLPIVNGTRYALEAWLPFRDCHEGSLFVRIDAQGRLIEGRLTGQTIWYIVDQRRQEANVQKCTPHDLRRTLISDLLDAGADIVTVQRLAGHADITTTARYDRRGEAAKRKAAELIHVPYLPKAPEAVDESIVVAPRQSV